MAKNPVNVMDFYVKLANIKQRYNVPPGNVINCDEKGYQLGLIGNEKVIVVQHTSDDERDWRAGELKQPGSRETITTIDAMCDDGNVLPPFSLRKGNMF
ncbi:hypothetical protein FRC12_009386 [Ceratobasidium sp. 428]|nr:hypothetical protein FRC12_009386 [Ceratobasidium sp. 428]